jgi:GxxExxY protein
MTFYALRVNGYKEEDRMTTKGTKATEVKSEEDGAVLGEYFADLFADNRPIIELKTCKALANEQTAQVLGYLCSSGQRHALLIHLVPQEFNSKKTVL